jgi:hypothetical protein
MPIRQCSPRNIVTLRLKCDGTRTETRFGLSAKRTSPFKSAGGASVQSTTGSRGVRISGSNAGYTVLRGSVRVLATHSIRQFPLHFPSRAIRFQLDSTTSSEAWRVRRRQVKARAAVLHAHITEHYVITAKNAGGMRMERHSEKR